MKTSCGVIIINEENELLMGHVTGQKFHDIPKGLLEAHESAIDCVQRECLEETAFVLEPSNLLDIGLHAYNKEKQLHLFTYAVRKESIDLNALTCNSYFEHFYTKKQTPEVDDFMWVPLSQIENYTAKSMGKLLTKLTTDLMAIHSPPTKMKP